VAAPALLTADDLELDLVTATADPLPPTMGEDGWPERLWKVDGEVRTFSLQPWPVAERPVYWNPIYPGQEMWWRSQKKNRLGMQPVIQKERWTDGKFAPRNEWELMMTREFLASLPLCADPEDWKGITHPDGEAWRCGECKFLCGNWRAYKAHCTYLNHAPSLLE
jgi:hypothetical protein